MENKIKHALKVLVSLSALTSTLICSNLTVQASDNQRIFLPFRSDLVKYITSNASSKGLVIQSQWLRLFEEEANNENWSDKYFSDYTASNGQTLSSKSQRVTYNSSFDTFLFSTITANPDFIENWINQTPDTMEGYCNDYRQHPIFCQGIVEATADGYLLGDGYNHENNSLQFAFTNHNFWDLKVLAILSNCWNKLSKRQQDWCKTYLPYLVKDYEENGENAIAAKENNPALYNLMAISNEGFLSSKGQEFFSHVISEPSLRIGDLLKNIVTANSLDKDILSEDVYYQNNLAIIFAGDADCDYTSDNLGDDDFDWLAYTICFSNDETWSRFRQFVDGDSTSSNQKQQWLLRYYTKGGNSQNTPKDIKKALDNQGKSASEHGSSFFVSGCNKTAKPSGSGFACWNDHIGYGSYSTKKPLGVSTISFSHSDYYTCYYQWKVVDTSTGNVIDSCGTYTSAPTIKLPAKYIWSSNISVTVYMKAVKGALGPVGEGHCYQGYATPVVVWTYAKLSDCDINNHSYEYSYTFDNNHATCTAVGTCVKCGDQITVTDYNIKNTENEDFYIYTAEFAHTEISPKTDKVAKTKGKFTYDASNKFITGSTSNSQTKSKVYTGEGFSLQVATNSQCSLASGAIQAGAKKLTVSSVATTNTYILYDSFGRELISRTIKTGGEKYGGASLASYTFDLRDYSDEQLEGAYLVIKLYSHSLVEGGYELGQTVSAYTSVRFINVEIEY